MLNDSMNFEDYLELRTDQGEWVPRVSKGLDGNWWVFLKRSSEIKNAQPTKIPPEAERISFVGAGVLPGMLRAFAKSSWPRKLKTLFVGDASGGLLPHDLDYRETVQILSTAAYPWLEDLTLGGFELFSNSHGGYGPLGNIAPMLGACPKLKRLELGGHFTLEGFQGLPYLEDLEVRVSDMVTGLDGGQLSQETLDTLLRADFPRLRRLELDLSRSEETGPLRLCETFLSGAVCPALEVFITIGEYPPEELERQHASPMAARTTFQSWSTAEEWGR